MTIDQVMRLIHAYVEPEKCYHEWEFIHPNFPKGIRPWKCTICGELSWDKEPNPDYSTRAHFQDLTDKLFEDERMYDDFEGWVANEYNELHCTGISKHFVVWLFSDYSRFCSLFAKFLQLPGTVEEFGKEECRLCQGRGTYAAGSGYDPCPKCGSTGKILKPWAAMVIDHSHRTPKNVDERIE